MTTTFLHGDCRQVLQTLPDKHFYCCVTSPPYFGLRDYGVEGQIGLEPTPAEYVAALCAVFDEVWRVLRDDGTLWLNLGDSYAGSWGNYAPTGSGGQRAKETERFDRAAYRDKSAWRPPTSNKLPGLKPKDLIGIPWRVAFALQERGWYLRSDIIWAKGNCMPESVTDRPTRSHEYIFLLSKSERYHYDAGAIREPLAEESWGRMGRKQSLMDRLGVGTLGKQIENGVNTSHSYAGLALGRNGKTGYNEAGRNKRSVWQVNSRPFKDSHFAVFPPELITPCILAGCPAGGAVIDPFGGSFTTAAVSAEYGRDCTCIELNAAYHEIGKRRMARVQRRMTFEEAA